MGLDNRDRQAEAAADTQPMATISALTPKNQCLSLFADGLLPRPLRHIASIKHVIRPDPVPPQKSQLDFGQIVFSHRNPPAPALPTIWIARYGSAASA
jgi:hypothetical protein